MSQKNLLEVKDLPLSIVNNHDILTEIFSFSDVNERNKKKKSILEIKLRQIILKKKTEQIIRNYEFRLSRMEVSCLEDYFVQLLYSNYIKEYSCMKSLFKDLSQCQCCHRHCYGKPININDTPSEIPIFSNGDYSCSCRCRHMMRFINRAVYNYHS